jgi:isopenicillin N synthase-like dioxygenase
MESCGIGEYPDFGFLTILRKMLPAFKPSPRQASGLIYSWFQICLWRTVGIHFVQLAGFMTNSIASVGDILDRLTSGLYISPFHRVLPPSPISKRHSILFFFDPAWTAKFQLFPLHRK